MTLWKEKDYGVLADRAVWAMLAVLVVVVGLRIFCRVLYGRNKLGGGLGIDDYITVGCLVVFLGTCILVTLGSSYGLGRHYTDIPEDKRVQALKYNVVISSVLIWTFSLPKFAIIAVLKRILEYGTKTTILFWGLALSSQACVFATSVWWFEQCSPVEYGWNQMIKGSCANISVLADLGYFTSAYSAFLDILFAIYPIPFIMRLNMPFKKRVLVSIALGLSALACVVSIYKLAIFGQVFEILVTDPTYPVPYLDILGTAEGCILIVCASLPTLGPLFRLGKGKVTNMYGSGPGSHNQLGDSTPSHSRSMSRNWDNFKGGHKLEDPEQSIATRVSIDAIPLVTRSKTNDYNHKDIHKTVNVSVSSDSIEQQSQRIGNVQ